MKSRDRNLRLYRPDRSQVMWAAGWIPTSIGMPEPGSLVLACIKNGRLGRQGPICAKWIAARTMDLAAHRGSGQHEETSAACWAPEGWYEACTFGAAPLSLVDEPITHWMAIPPTP